MDMSDNLQFQLARKFYAIDSDVNNASDDSSDGSLEILSRNGAMATSSSLHKEKTIHVVETSRNVSAANEEMSSNVAYAQGSELFLDVDDSSDDSCDKLLSRCKPTFSKSNSTFTNATNFTQARPVVVERKRPISSISRTNVHRTTSVSSSETKEEARRRREEERDSKKHETERRKQMEKIARQERREREKEERIRQKEADRQSKQREKNEMQQAAGKFSANEVLLLMDPSLHQSNEYGIADVLEKDFLVKEYVSSFTFKKTVQWVRKDHLEGGADDAWQCLLEGKPDKFEHVSYLLVIVDYDDYIPLIERIEHDVDNDFPKLGSLFETLKREWRTAWSTEEDPRIVLMLNRVAEDLDWQWSKGQRNRARNNSGTPLPSEWELRDSLLWLLVQFQVDCIECSSNEEIQANVHKLTRGIAEAPYAAQASELECVRKIKSASDLGDDPFHRSHDTWFRQLQMIPMISEQRARNLLHHYPTLQSLWQAYQQGDESGNRGLLSGCFDERSSQASISAAIQKVLTCRDPKAMV